MKDDLNAYKASVVHTVEIAAQMLQINPDDEKAKQYLEDAKDTLRRLSK
jgi:hypothetical protein